MKKIYLFLFGIISLFILSSCVKEDPDVFGSISGYVTDSNTKERLSGVTVLLQPGGLSMITGDDGSFSFLELETGTYLITFSCDSYENYGQSVVVKAGVDASIQVSLDPILPELHVSTTKMDFGSKLNTLPFDITNTGKGELQWELKYDLPWLTCSPTKGTVTNEKSTVSVTLNRSVMERGKYEGSIVVSSNGGSQTIFVYCTHDGIHLSVEPEELDFGSLTNSMQLTLRNTGKGTLHYKASAANNWLKLDKKEGNITDVDYLGVVVSRGALSAGDYNSSILLSADSGTISIPVKMQVAVNERPTVSVEQPTEIKYNSVIMHGTILSPGSDKITRYGFCWMEGEGDPTIEDNFTNLGDCTTPMAFESYVTNLKSETWYSYRAYAENSVGISYSDKIQGFITKSLPTVPGVITGYVNETGSSTAEVRGQITSLGNVDEILHYGHVWSKSDNPTLESAFATDYGTLKQVGTYTSMLTDLDANTSYYYRAYATNEKGTAYGETLILTTYKGDPQVKTLVPTNIMHNAATAGGEITDTGGNIIIGKGVCWSTSPKPEVNYYGENVVYAEEEEANQAGSRAKTRKVTENANKYAQSANKYAANSNKLAENTKMSAAFSNMSAAYSKMPQANSKTSSAISSFSSAAPIQRAPIPGGSFTCRIEGLEKLTTYYVRAFVIVEGGYYYYGEDQQFTTTDEVKLPTVSDVSVSNIKPTTAEVTATVISNGNAELSSCGFCYGTNPEMIGDLHYVECDPNSTSFGKTLTDLEQNTIYYVWAFAVNYMGVAYSISSTQFMTDAISRPILSSVIVDNIGKTTATVTSSLVSDGNSPLGKCGFVWSTTAYPTTSDNMGDYEVNANNFTCKLTNLPELSTIHVRAYAINDIGTGYSDDMIFQTTDVDNDVWDGSIATKFGGGVGMLGNPIQVTSADQLALLARNVNNGTTYNGVYFILTTNISLDHRAWTPIGDKSNTFAGNFDGGGMVISGLNNTSGFGGLFGNNSGTIQNVNVSGKTAGSNNTAGIAATNSGTILNCVSSVSVEGFGVVGGIVATNTGMVVECRNQGAVNSIGDNVGGICGYSEGGLLDGNKNSGYVTGRDHVGGICGEIKLEYEGTKSLPIRNNFNSGRVIGNSYAGGIVGYAFGRNIATSSSNGTELRLEMINNCNIGELFGTTIGGIAGYISIDGYWCTSCHYSSGTNQRAVLVFQNNNSNQSGLIGYLARNSRGTSQGYNFDATSFDYGYSFWLYDIMNNTGVETGATYDTDGTIDNSDVSHDIYHWYHHDNAGCYLKDTFEDIVDLHNNWVNYNSADTHYKRWKYESIDGFAVPVFEE